MGAIELLRKPAAVRVADVHGGRRRRDPGEETPLLGIFNVENILGAVAAATLLDVDDEAIAEGVRAVRGVPGRFEAVDEGQDFAVVVDYSHKPDALAAALQASRELGPGRLTVVFGAGGDRDRTKRAEMVVSPASSPTA